MKKLLIILMLFAAVAIFAQQTPNVMYSKDFDSCRNQIDFAFYIDPTADSLWILTGADNLHKIPNAPPGIHTEIAPPQALLLKVSKGHLYKVWELQQSVATLIADSNKDIQQWGFEWNKIGAFVNGYDPQNNGQDNHYLQIIDPTFHMVNIPVGMSDMHEALVRDSDIYELMYLPYGYAIEKRHYYSQWQYYTSEIIARTQISDTAQTQLRAGSCLNSNNRFTIGDPNEFFHQNSIAMVPFEGGILFFVSERHTGQIRIFIWFNAGLASEYARIGATNNPFNTEHWLGDSVTITGGHDFRLVKSFGSDSMIVSYFDDGTCPNTTASGLVMMWYPKTHNIRLMQRINLGLQVQALGSFRVMLGSDSSIGAILAAPKIMCHGVGQGRPSHTGGLAPQGFWPVDSGGQIDLRYPGASKPLVALTYSNMFNWDGKICVGLPYRATTYYENQLPSIWQPEIMCLDKVDSLELSVQGLPIVDSWSHDCGNHSASIMISKAQTGRFTVEGKTDSAMIGLLYSKPIWISNGQCLTSPPSEISGVGEDVAPVIQVYPNPSKGTLFVNIPEEGKITITDALGRLVTQADVSAETIRLEEVPKGINIVTFVKKTGYKTTSKIVVE